MYKENKTIVLHRVIPLERYSFGYAMYDIWLWASLSLSVLCVCVCVCVCVSVCMYMCVGGSENRKRDIKLFTYDGVNERLLSNAFYPCDHN